MAVVLGFSLMGFLWIKEFHHMTNALSPKDFRHGEESRKAVLHVVDTDFKIVQAFTNSSYGFGRGSVMSSYPMTIGFSMV